MTVLTPLRVQSLDQCWKFSCYHVKEFFWEWRCTKFRITMNTSMLGVSGARTQIEHWMLNLCVVPNCCMLEHVRAHLALKSSFHLSMHSIVHAWFLTLTYMVRLFLFTVIIYMLCIIVFVTGFKLEKGMYVWWVTGNIDDWSDRFDQQFLNFLFGGGGRSTNVMIITVWSMI